MRARTVLLLAVSCAVSGALAAGPSVGVRLLAPSGTGFTVAIFAADGGVVWRRDERTFAGAAGGSSGLWATDGGEPWLPGRYTIAVERPAWGPRQCSRVFTLAGDGTVAILTIGFVDAGCTIDSYSADLGGPPAPRGLFNPRVGDFPPYESPWVQPATKP